ncbi:MAG: hypothetical protein ACNA7G_00525 [Methylobacter sp.]
MKKLTTCFIVTGGLLLSACATQTGWTPTVDTYNNPNAYRLSQDMAECRELSIQAAGGTAKEAAIGAGVGGLIGAAGGAAVGAITGGGAGAGKGAAIGGAVGGIGGGAKQGIESEAAYKRAYSNCLRNRGHRVVN